MPVAVGRRCPVPKLTVAPLTGFVPSVTVPDSVPLPTVVQFG